MAPEKLEVVVYVKDGNNLFDLLTAKLYNKIGMKEVAVSMYSEKIYYRLSKFELWEPLIKEINNGKNFSKGRSHHSHR